MQINPFADRFPMLPQEELDRLADDIRENGLRNPVVLDSEGRILDGRNRWVACELAGVTPNTVPFDGDDEAAFVLSVNVARRHLTTGQQAMSTALVLADAGKRVNGKWAYGSAALGNSENLRNWQKHMQVAGVILDHADDLAQSVVDGGMALDAAFREAEKRRDAERNALAEQERIDAEEADARARLEELAPEYLDRYDNARVAFTAWESDNRAAAAKERQEKAAREAEEARLRKDLTHTFSRIAEGCEIVGAFGSTMNGSTMDRFRPDLLSPPQRIRAFDVQNLRDGIRFLEYLIQWKEQAHV